MRSPARRGRGALALLAAAAAAGAAAEPPPLAHFFAAPRLERFRISPDGTRVLGISPRDDDWAVAVIDLDGMRSVATLRTEERPVLDAWWASDERILVSVSDANGRGARLVSADARGRDLRRLRGRTAGRGPRPEAFELLHGLPEHETQVLVSELVRVPGRPGATRRVHRIDLETGASRRIAEDADALSWLADPEGALRFRERAGGPGPRFAYRADGEGWEPVAPIDGRPLDPSRFLPLGFDTATGDPIVVVRHRSDRFAPRRYRAAAPRLSAPLFEDPEVDVAGPAARTRGGRLRGIHYHRDGWRTFWLLPAWRERAARLESALPGVTVTLVDWDDAERRFLVRAQGERRPPVVLVYTESDPPTLESLASLYPELAPEGLVASRALRYPARDGTPIHGYLTLPAGSGDGPPPLVVLVHDGPWTAQGGIRLRGGHVRIGFDPEVQWLASRGWAVFRPDYRGSTGRGRSHERAGWGRWGLEMQHDVTDGVRALIARGVVDPERLCIFGHGYGGYAALWGAVHTPDLYRCAAAYNGVYDLPRLLADTRWLADGTEALRRIGAPDAQLARVSPARHAGAIGAAVLLASGREPGPGGRWSGEQLEAMRAALEAAGRPPTVVRLPEDGEGLGRESSRLALYGALERFFRTHLDGGRGGVRPSPSGGR